MMKRWVAYGFCVALTACAGYDGAGLRAGASGDEVRAAMGAPATVWQESDGGATWEYPRGPSGLHTYMVRLDKDGRMREIRQVLTVETFNQIRPGTTTREQVRRLLGTPASETYFARRSETVWDYRYRDLVSTYDYAFHVMFDPKGMVTGTGTTVDDPRYTQSGPSGLN